MQLATAGGGAAGGLSALLSSSSSSASTPSLLPHPPFHETPALQGINRRPAHVPLRSHRTVREALDFHTAPLPTARELFGGAGDDGAAAPPPATTAPTTTPAPSLISPLGGPGALWDFALVPSPAHVDPAFVRPEFQPSADKGWGKTPVPSSWECQGHGVPIYTNFVYPIPVDPPLPPQDDNPTGCYRLAFEGPPLPTPPPASSARPYRAYLSFGGFDSALYVWLNGKFVGASKDARLAAEFDVTDLLLLPPSGASGGAAAAGGGATAPTTPTTKNVLAAVVVRWSDATYLEDQDMWRLSGLHRPVELLLKPAAARVADFSARTPLEFCFGSAAPSSSSSGGVNNNLIEVSSVSLEADVMLELDPSTPPEDVSVRAHLFEADTGRAVFGGVGGGGDGADGGESGPFANSPIELEVCADPLSRWYAAQGARQQRVPARGATAMLRLRDGALKGRFEAAAASAAATTTTRAWPPRLWSAEDPALYVLVLELRVKGRTLETEACLLGFRDDRICGGSGGSSGGGRGSSGAGRLLHNGRPVTLRGVNRHEWDPIAGKALDAADLKHPALRRLPSESERRGGGEAESGGNNGAGGANNAPATPAPSNSPYTRHALRDLYLMKRANLNAVRLSHYPNDPRFLDLCARVGLYAIDEANWESHGFDAAFAHDRAHPAHHTAAGASGSGWLSACLDRVVRMYERDKNCAAVVAWSLGNEAGHAAAHDAAAAWLRGREDAFSSLGGGGGGRSANPPSTARPVHYEGGGSRTAATDLVCPMYARPWQLDALARVEEDEEEEEDKAAAATRTVRRSALRHAGGRPVISCEYAHCMGNSGGNLAAYWALWDGGQAEAEEEEREAAGGGAAASSSSSSSPSPLGLSGGWSRAMWGRTAASMAAANATKNNLKNNKAYRARLQGGFIWDWADQALLARLLAEGERGAAPGAIARVVGGRGASAAASSSSSLLTWAVGGDFGDKPNDGQFCCNGLVGPDRAPNPAYHEAAAAMAPIKLCWWSAVSALAGGGGALSAASASAASASATATTTNDDCILVANRQDFSDTSALVFEWRLLVHGRPVLGAKGGNDNDNHEGWRRDATLVPLDAASSSSHAASFLSTSPTPPYAIPARGYGLLRLPLTPARLAALAVGAANAAAPLAPPLLPGDAVVDVRCCVAAGAWVLDNSHVVARRQLPVPLADLRLQLGVAEPHAVLAAAGAGVGGGAAVGAAAAAATTQDPVAAWEAHWEASSSSEDDTSVISVEKQPDGGVVVELRRPGEEARPPRVVFRARVGGDTGCLEELWVAAGGGEGDTNSPTKNLLTTPLTPCLFRAATDNDRGGSGGASHAARWAAAGLDRLAVVPGSCDQEELKKLFDGSEEWEDVRKPVVEVVSSASTADPSSPAASAVVVRSSFEMRPRRMADPALAAAAAAGAGVSEVGGAHWFADGKDEAEGEERDGAAAAGGASSSPPSPSSPLALVRVSVEYELRPRSSVVLTRWDVDASRALPARPPQGLPRSLPRVGLHAAVAALGGAWPSAPPPPPPPPPNPDPRSPEERSAASLARVRWFGRGPHECYPDRKYGAVLGVYDSTPDALHTPYVSPQENGGRADVRWLALQPPSLPSSSPPPPSLAFVCAGANPPPLAPSITSALGAADPDGDGGLSGSPHSLALASVSRHSALELHAARHQHELPGFGGGGATTGAATAATATTLTSAVVHVHLDAAHMGVGGDDSWSPTVHDAYLLPPGRYRFGVAVVVAGGGNDDGEQQRRRLTGLHHALAERWLITCGTQG